MPNAYREIEEMGEGGLFQSPSNRVLVPSMICPKCGFDDGIQLQSPNNRGIVPSAADRRLLHAAVYRVSIP